MNVPEQTLLPSQETLLQRLYHAACYNDQLTLIAGDEGSGKTTLVTALVTELEEYNSALVTCPLHADNAEIRRKILVQLLTDPLFDDEVTLADTILRLSSTLTRPLHLVIDDAHFLSQELWAELMILSKLKCADKAITITMTVTPAHMALQMAQLSPQMREMILPISIESLNLAEREALYQTLLSRSEQMPFTPREIVKEQLRKQTGTPLEVISLINLALYGEEASKKQTYGKVIAVGAAVISVIFAVLGWVYFSKDEQVTPQKPSVTAVPLPHSANIALYGEKFLKEYFSLRQVNLQKLIHLEKKQLHNAPSKDNGNPIVEVKSELTEQLADALAVTNVKTANVDLQPASEDLEKKDSSESMKKTEARVNDEAPTNTSASVPQKAVTNQAPNYQVYTLQVANLSTKKSLAAVLESLKGFEDIFVMKKGNSFIVFQGNFEDEAAARHAAKILEQKAKLPSPWLRQWQQLEQYQLLKHYPDGEITQ